MALRNHRVDDSDSLNTATGDSSSSDDASRVQSTKTSTPATSVLGEDKRTTTASRRAPLHRKSAVAFPDGDSDSELSELDEELGSSRKKRRVGGDDAGSRWAALLPFSSSPSLTCPHISMLFTTPIADLPTRLPPPFATIA